MVTRGGPPIVDFKKNPQPYPVANFRLQKRLGLTIFIFAFLATTLNWFNSLVLHHASVQTFLFDIDNWVALVVGGAFFMLSRRNSQGVRFFQAMVVFCASGPLIYVNLYDNFFGYWMLISGIMLLYKYGFLNQQTLTKSFFILAWTVFWIFMSFSKSYNGTPVDMIKSIAFLTTSLVVIYLIFEDEIRHLLAANKLKDDQLAQQEAQIAQLVPLSELGKRTAHIVHSFRNNLNQISTALYLLEEINDPQMAAQKLRIFSTTLSDRIDSILMISRASGQQTAEYLDMTKILEGLRFLYLQESTFVQHIKTEFSIEAPSVMLKVVLSELIMMFENLLSNALDAIVEQKKYGTVQIILKQDRMIFANDGGAMALCVDCGQSCLSCSKYGQIGVTTKHKGSGHGLPQIFQTIRNHGWDLKIHSNDLWTSFEIFFQEPTF